MIRTVRGVGIAATTVVVAMALAGAVYPEGEHPAEPLGQPQAQAGSIQGTVALHLRPPRRSASRYPGGAAQSHTVQPLPPVVFLEGPISGVPARTPTARHTLAQRDTAFVPGALVVQAGSTIVFPNEDTFFHNVFSYSSAARFDLGRYPRGEAKEVQVDEPGIVKVYCEVHEFMRAVVVVTENPFHAVVDSDGSFTLSGVPAGTYTLVAWHPDVDEVRETVVVSDGGTTRVDVELR